MGNLINLKNEFPIKEHSHGRKNNNSGEPPSGSDMESRVSRLENNFDKMSDKLDRIIDLLNEQRTKTSILESKIDSKFETFESRIDAKICGLESRMVKWFCGTTFVVVSTTIGIMVFYNDLLFKIISNIE